MWSQLTYIFFIIIGVRSEFKLFAIKFYAVFSHLLLSTEQSRKSKFRKYFVYSSQKSCMYTTRFTTEYQEINILVLEPANKYVKNNRTFCSEQDTMCSVNYARSKT